MSEKFTTKTPKNIEKAKTPIEKSEKIEKKETKKEIKEEKIAGKEFQKSFKKEIEKEIKKEAKEEIKEEKKEKAAKENKKAKIAKNVTAAKTEQKSKPESEILAKTTEITENTENEVEDKKRIKLAIDKPIEYFYSVAMSRSGSVEFVEINQSLNDKFVGRIAQNAYFPIAEATKRIFELNSMLFEQAIADSLINSTAKFVVQVSAKWFASQVKINQLEKYLAQFKDNIVLSFDAVSLTESGKNGLEAFKRMVKDHRSRILLDNVEFANLSRIIAYHPDYIRLDARLIDKSDENYKLTLQFMKDYAKAQHFKIVVTNVADAVLKNFLLTIGVDAVQGSGIYKAKKNYLSIIKDFNIR